MTRATLSLFLAGCFACGPNRTIPEKEAYVPPELEPLSCVPNLDGVISATEIQAALDIPVHYVVNPTGTTRSINVAGAISAQGNRVWDFATDYADDQVATISASALSSHWFASTFPTGQWAAPLDLGGSVLGVYAHDGSNVLLLGYASPLENPPEGRTLVVYGAPVQVYRFPLETGKTWVSVGQVTNGLVRGLPYAGRDTYTTRVDASGQLELPDVTFSQAMRVRTTTSIEPAVGASIVRRQVGWVFECFGEVARAVAPDGVTTDDFTTATELRRLGL